MKCVPGLVPMFRADEKAHNLVARMGLRVYASKAVCSRTIRLKWQ